MKALVLYDSEYGNTERLAETVALVLQEAIPTRLAKVSEVDDLAEALFGVDLVVVGGPTHAHGLSETLRTALGTLGERALLGLRAAAFDTRIHGPRVVTGSAAARLSRQLRHRGAWVVVPSASFIVDGTEGPLHEGELERARLWARTVLEAAGVRLPAAVR